MEINNLPDNEFKIRIIKKLNTELKEKGYITVAGRVSRKYYEERTYGLTRTERSEGDASIQR